MSKTTGKDSSETCAIDFQNCVLYLVFPSGMTSHSEIAQFNRECMGGAEGISGRMAEVHL